MGNRLGIWEGPALIPKDGADLTRYSVIACDQYTSNLEYWNEAARIASGAPSALDMVFPEVYLGGQDDGARIEGIRAAMERCLKDGFFRETGLPIFVERECSAGIRRGLVTALDLEMYSFEEGANTLIRPTEGTIAERIPPRAKVRENAPLELSHIMVLIDDKSDAVFKAAREACDIEPIYDFRLMLGGGRIKGFRVVGSGWMEELDALYDSCGGMLYAMGDGNHSMATAKAHWERLKSAGAPLDHPARWALCEIVNLNDPALLFEPIHRAVMGIDMPGLLSAAQEALSMTPREGWHALELFYGDRREKAWLDPALHPIAAGAADALIARAGDIGVDYIHGEAELERVCAEGRALGLLLPGMKKEELFPAVRGGGPLPRKTFSLGDADDKRFYMEARLIRHEDK